MKIGMEDVRTPVWSSYFEFEWVWFILRVTYFWA